MATKESFAFILSELIKRLSPEERVELMRHISWQELEEWKATQESLSDPELMTNLAKGLADEENGKLSGVKI
ncbi:MAG: hypothetical protein AAB037_04335 [Chloroflexota bacterium]